MSSSPSPVWHFPHSNTYSGMQFSPPSVKTSLLLLQNHPWRGIRMDDFPERQKYSVFFSSCTISRRFECILYKKLIRVNQKLIFTLEKTQTQREMTVEKKNLSMRSEEELRGWRKCLGQESLGWRENKGITNTNKTSIWQNDLLFWLNVLHKSSEVWSTFKHSQHQKEWELRR